MVVAMENERQEMAQYCTVIIAVKTRSRLRKTSFAVFGHIPGAIRDKLPSWLRSRTFISPSTPVPCQALLGSGQYSTYYTYYSMSTPVPYLLLLYGAVQATVRTGAFDFTMTATLRVCSLEP